MKYCIAGIIAFSILVPFQAHGKIASPYPFDSYDSTYEALSESVIAAEFDALLDEKYLETEYEYATAGGPQTPLIDAQNFLRSYNSKIKTAAANTIYQKKLAALKAKPMPFVHYFQNSELGESIYKNLVSLRKEFFARIKQLNLPSPNSKVLPAKFNSIAYDEKYSSRVLDAYDSNVSACIFRRIDIHSCSYIISPRGENMINIAHAALAAEDMPVFYGAISELNEIINKHIKPKTPITHVFKNAVDLGI